MRALPVFAFTLSSLPSFARSASLHPYLWLPPPPLSLALSLFVCLFLLLVFSLRYASIFPCMSLRSSLPCKHAV